MSSLKLPARFAGKVVDQVRSRGMLETVRHLLVVGRHHAHERLVPARCRELGPTAGKVELATLAVEGGNRSAGVHYLPTPWRVLEWVHALLPADKAHLSFVDLGAGKGRAVLSAALHSYAEVIGVEFAPALARIAQANVEGLPSGLIKAGSIAIRCEDAGATRLPEGPLVLFLFNPFGPPVIDRVADLLQSSYEARRRPIWVAYLNPAHPAFERLACLEQVRPGRAARLRLQLASPYNLALFATREARRA